MTLYFLFTFLQKYYFNQTKIKILIFNLQPFNHYGDICVTINNYLKHLKFRSKEKVEDKNKYMIRKKFISMTYIRLY